LSGQLPAAWSAAAANVGELILEGADSASSYGAAAQKALASAKAIYNSQEPAQMLGNLEGISVGAAFILKDLHRHMDEPVVVRRLRDVGQKFSDHRRTIILTSPKIEIPAELRGLVEFFELPLPDRRRLRQIIDEVVVRISKDHTLQRKRGAKGFDTVVESLRGLTEEETERALSQALVTRYALCPEIASDVLETKKSLLRRSEMLEFVEAGEAFTGVGGTGQPKTVAYSEARFVGRLGTRVRTGTTARRNHSRAGGMREAALRAGCGGRVEPAAGKV
jgi:hypothetical protein